MCSLTTCGLVSHRGLRPAAHLRPTTCLSRRLGRLPSAGSGARRFPCSLRTDRSALPPAASPRRRRRPSPWPPHRHAKPATELANHIGRTRTASRPISTRLEPIPRLRSYTTGSSRTPSDPARRTQPVWQYQAVPALSALLPTQPGVPRVGLRSAPTKPLRQPSEEVSHLLRFPAPHGAPAPRGAPSRRRT